MSEIKQGNAKGRTLVFWLILGSGVEGESEVVQQDSRSGDDQCFTLLYKEIEWRKIE